jgi:hypothetical protein
MRQLTSIEISRQDCVDGAIFKLLQSVNPTSQPIEWDIEMIGGIRDTLQEWIVDRLHLCTPNQFYPFIEEQNGNQGNSD